MIEKAKEYRHLLHPNPPVWNTDSRFLILGTFPSVKSRETGFYYGHPQNRFWKLLSAVLGEPLPHTVEEKKALLFLHHIALWDVIAECDIAGSADSAIRNVRPNDIEELLQNAPIEKIFVTGKTAETLYNRCLLPKTNRPVLLLPSPSPANAAWSFERLLHAWKELLADLCSLPAVD